MKDFLKLRLLTFISTCIITYLFTGDFFFTSALSLTLIGVNTIIMYLVLRKDNNMPRHVERNDGIKCKNKLALQRYNFAMECFKNYKRSILDLGCGMGYGCYLLREAGHDVLGVDCSQEAIDYARKEYPGRYEIADLNVTTYYWRDAVVCLETLCHLRDPQNFIDSLIVDEVVISAPIDPDPRDGYKWRLHNLSEKQFKDLLKGWTIINELRQKKYLTLHIIKK